MKKTIAMLICMALMGSCGRGGGDCERLAAYGDVEICLPAINGMVESYDIPKVKARADAFNPGMNLILGYYLSDATHRQIDSLDKVVLDDYFQIYAAKSLQGIEITTDNLDRMGATISDNYIKENWGDLNEKIKEEFDFSSDTKPILLDSYTPNPDARTYVLLLKHEEGDDFHIYVSTMNVLKLHNRMVFMAYYKAFKNEETLTRSKEKNDKIVGALIRANT